MKLLTAFSAFVLVAAASLTWKVMLAEIEDPPPSIRPAIIEVLERSGFNPTGASTPNDLAWVSAESASCRLTVFEVSPDGWHESVIGLDRTGGQRLIFTFAGHTYSRQPSTLTRLTFHWNRVKRYLGAASAYRPVLAILTSSSCAQVPLQALSDIRGQSS